MNFKIAICIAATLSLAAANVVETVVASNGSTDDSVPNEHLTNRGSGSSSSSSSFREGKFLAYKSSAGEKYRKLQELNALEEEKKSEAYAGEALDGVYLDCLSQVSFSCVQKKVLNFINRINRMEKFTVLGDYVSVVRTKNEYKDEPEFQARLDTAEEQSRLDEVMDTTIDRFLNSHIFRVKVPNSFSMIKPAGNRNFDGTTYLDFQFPYADETQARKKGGGGGGKMGKKMMMMMMMGLKAKMMMLGPLILGMAGLMAIKALIASVISLTISKIMIIKKLMKNKGGFGGGHGGGGWDNSGSGGGGPWASGGGGWDRRSIYEKSDRSSWDASDLAYRAYSTVENLF